MRYLLTRYHHTTAIWLLASLALFSCQRKAGNEVSAPVSGNGMANEVHALLDKADSLISAGNAKDAIHRYRTLLDSLPGDTACALHCYAGIGRALMATDHSREAAPHLKKVLSYSGYNNSRPYADANALLGEILSSDPQKADSAIMHYEKALSVYEKVDPSGRNTALNFKKLGQLYMETFRAELADRSFEKARRIIENLGDDGLRAEICLHLANSRRELNDLLSAWSFTRTAIGIIKQGPGHNLALLGQAYESCGTLTYVEREYRQAISWYRKAIAAHNASGKLNLLGRSTFNLSLSYIALERYDSALLFLDRSIAYDLPLFGFNSDRIATRLLNKGAVYEKMNAFSVAVIHYRQALGIREKIFGAKHTKVYGAKWAIAELYNRLEHTDSAAFYYQQALISMIHDFHDPRLSANPVPHRSEISLDLFDALLSKARILQKLYRQREEIAILENSLSAYKLADSVFHVFQRYYYQDDLKLNLFQRVPFGEMMAAAHELYSLTGSRQALELNFMFMEKARANIMHDALNRIESYVKADVRSDIRTEERFLISQRADLIKQLQKYTRTEHRHDSLSGELLKIDQQHDEIQQQLAITNPVYSTARYGGSESTTSELRQHLKKRNAVLIEYFWGEKSIYALCASQQHVNIDTIAITPTLMLALDTFLDELRIEKTALSDKTHFRRYVASAHLLYKELVKKPLEGIHNPSAKTLIILPDRKLALMSFEALVTANEAGDEVNYRLPYLLHDFTISYGYAFRLLQKQTQKRKEGSRLLAFGYAGGRPMANTQRNGYAGLPGTESEINAIRAIMKNDNNKYFTGKDATEARFKKEAQAFDIIHLAVHGEADTVSGYESKLIFRPDKDAEDGELYASELYNLDLEELDLVVLSACESGIGKQYAGEGALSIARGFAYAGCPSVINTLWRIDDEASAEIMADLYSVLWDNTASNAALKKSKLNYLSTANEFRSHPRFWAGIVSIGDPEIFLKNRSTGLLWICCFVVLCGILLTLLFVYSSRRQKP